LCLLTSLILLNSVVGVGGSKVRLLLANHVSRKIGTPGRRQGLLITQAQVDEFWPTPVRLLVFVGPRGAAGTSNGRRAIVVLMDTPVRAAVAGAAASQLQQPLRALTYARRLPTTMSNQLCPRRPSMVRWERCGEELTRRSGAR
jgi:hypothetical protein